MPRQFDIIILGGGLSGGLLAYWLKFHHPNNSILLIEKNSKLGGDHTWSFHGEDLSPYSLKIISPLISKTWHGYDVHFPKYSRKLYGTYHSIKSEHFHSVLTEQMPENILLNTSAEVVDEKTVLLSTDELLSTRLVFDARNLYKADPAKTGYQKFVGWEVELSEAHGLNRPVLIDANTKQIDGFRFFYLLPFTEATLLIEDTHYSNYPNLSVGDYELEIKKYIKDKGWGLKKIIRQEAGVLPIPLCNDYGTGVLEKGSFNIGMQGRNFHATTGYSLPDSVRMACWVTENINKSLEDLKVEKKSYAKKHEKKQNFYFILNQLLFLCSEPSRRYKIFEKFYTLRENTISRFYSGELKWGDYLRIFSGKPPTSIIKVIKYFYEQGGLYYAGNKSLSLR